jgi:4-aminobutyrate aminotransferase/(S)-3-amino-2-methylpropionate transaminase
VLPEIVPDDALTARRIVTEVPGPKSQALHERRLAAVPVGVSSTLPVYIARAHGAVIEDVDGNRFLDLGAGIGVTTIGHTNDAVVAAAQAQLGEFLHTLFTITPYESYVRVAELVAERTPGAFPKKTVLVNSGAEAVENGVKIARRSTGRRGVAVLEHGYHGRTSLTMAMNYKAMPYGAGFGPFPGDVHHVPGSYPFRDGLTGEQAAARTIDHLEKHIGAADLAILVVEPIQGEGGFQTPADGFLPALQRWANANGVVIAADEIQSGMGRTGAWFASEHFGFEPDLVLFAKGVAGGLPLAGVTGRAEIMDAAQPGGLGGTFGGNPVAAAAAVAVFEQIEQLDLLAAGRRIEARLRPALEALAEEFEIIGDVRGRGAMLAMELVEPGTRDSTKVPFPGAVARIADFAAQQGVLVLSAGTWGNVIRFLPSLVITDEQLDDAIGVLREALTAVR